MRKVKNVIVKILTDLVYKLGDLLEALLVAQAIRKSCKQNIIK